MKNMLAFFHFFPLYGRVWWKLTTVSARIALENRLGVVLFVGAKLLRFALFFFTISLLVSQVHAVAGFTRTQMLVLFFVFTLIDTLSQLLFREVYRFHQRVISGEFDFDLLKPLPSLLRPLLGGADPLDALTLFPLVSGFGWFLYQEDLLSQPMSVWLGFFLLMANSLVIAAVFHVIVLSLSIRHTQVDNAIMIYRDVWSMGRFPVSIYEGIVGILLRTLVPLSVMLTLPTQVLTSASTPLSVAAACVVGIGMSVLSVWWWRVSLRSYSSLQS